MIAFRHADSRYPFLSESEDQPAGRWHGVGEGPVQYFADTPSGAWAEFLRHEEITDPSELPGIRRAIWAAEIMDVPTAKPNVSADLLLGDRSTYQACQEAARSLRARGATGLVAPAAALLPGGAHGWQVLGGHRPGPSKDGIVVALFGARPDLVGWVAAVDGRPDERLLLEVRHFAASKRAKV